MWFCYLNRVSSTFLLGGLRHVHFFQWIKYSYAGSTTCAQTQECGLIFHSSKQRHHAYHTTIHDDRRSTTTVVVGFALEKANNHPPPPQTLFFSAFVDKEPTKACTLIHTHKTWRSNTRWQQYFEEPIKGRENRKKEGTLLGEGGGGV